MSYNLLFHPKALKEWKRLPEPVKALLKPKLEQRLENPHVPASRLAGGHNLYKIKIMRPPVRLTYQVNDNEFTVTALSIGRRDGNVYAQMLART